MEGVGVGGGCGGRYVKEQGKEGGRMIKVGG